MTPPAKKATSAKKALRWAIIAAGLIVVFLGAISIRQIYNEAHNAERDRDRCLAVNQGLDAVQDVLNIFVPNPVILPPENRARYAAATDRLRPVKCPGD